MKLRIITFLIIALCLTPLGAIHYSPYAEISSGGCFTTVLSYEDEVLARTSMFASATLHPLSMRIGGHTLSISLGALFNTETLVHSHIQLLGFQALEAGVAYQWQLSSFYALAFSLGLGYGSYHKAEAALTYLQGGVGHIFFLLDFLALSQRYQIAYRNGMLDHRLSIGLLIFPFGGTK